MGRRDSGREKRRLRAQVRKRLSIARYRGQEGAEIDGTGAYDPLAPPDPERWLATDEGERIAEASAYHRRAGLAMGDRSRDTLHASMHVIVENRLAMDVEGTRQELASLLARGMDRHEAVHVLAEGVAGEMFDIMKAQVRPDPDAPEHDASR